MFMFLIYLIGTVNTIKMLICFPLAIYTFIAIYLILDRLFYEKKTEEGGAKEKTLKKVILMACIFAAINIVIPNRTTLIGMVVTHYINTNPEIKNIPTKLVKILDIYLEEKLKINKEE